MQDPEGDVIRQGARLVGEIQRQYPVVSIEELDTPKAVLEAPLDGVEEKRVEWMM